MTSRWTAAMAAWICIAGGLGCGGTTVVPPSQAPQPKSDEEKLVCDRVVEDFADDTLGAFPKDWQVRDSDQQDLAAKTYEVVEVDGGRALHGTWQAETVTIGLVLKDWDLNRHPVLRYRWKVMQLPAGADETRDDLNDTAAAVYASWKVGFPMMVRGIKYAWSTSLAEGTRTSKRMKHDQMLVMGSGDTHLGEWRTVEVDVQMHALTFFEEKGGVGNPDGIAVMTDADSTGTSAEAYFADFELCHYE